MEKGIRICRRSHHEFSGGRTDSADSEQQSGRVYGAGHQRHRTGICGGQRPDAGGGGCDPLHQRLAGLYDQRRGAAAEPGQPRAHRPGGPAGRPAGGAEAAAGSGVYGQRRWDLRGLRPVPYRGGAEGHSGTEAEIYMVQRR